MDDYTLMAQIHCGDKEAFRAFYTHYNKHVYNMAFHGTNDQTKAVTVVKAVFQEIYHTLKTESVYTGDINAWLIELTEKYIAMFITPQSENELAKPNTADAVEVTPAKKAKTNSGNGLLVVLCLFSVMLVWVIVGILGSFGVIPQINLGYDWFNVNLYPLF